MVELENVYFENCEDTEKVFSVGRELEYVPEYDAMKKQCNQGEYLAAHMMFQEGKGNDCTVVVNTEEQFDTIAMLMGIDEEILKKELDGANLRDLTFREVYFLAAKISPKHK